MPAPLLLNKYFCYDCKVTWQNTGCDTQYAPCPNCGATVSPYTSLALGEYCTHEACVPDELRPSTWDGTYLFAPVTTGPKWERNPYGLRLDRLPPVGTPYRVIQSLYDSAEDSMWSERCGEIATFVRRDGRGWYLRHPDGAVLCWWVSELAPLWPADPDDNILDEA